MGRRSPRSSRVLSPTRALTAAIALSVGLAGACNHGTTGGAGAAATATAAPATPAPTAVPITVSTAARPLLAEGLELLDNSQPLAARPYFTRARAADPSSLAAEVLEGYATPGVAGLAEIDRALERAATLSSDERLWLQTLRDAHAGDRAAELQHGTALAKRLPKSWRAHSRPADALWEMKRFADARAEYETAAQLAPNVAAVWNLLAYAELADGKGDAAVEHLRKYAALRPTDPNPLDSLGEALLDGGRLEEAEKSFQQALTLDPTFAIAWEGVGFARLYGGKTAAGLDALQKGIDAATDPDDRLKMTMDLAVAELAAGRHDDAIRSVAATSAYGPWALATAPAWHALFEIESGRAAAARKLLDTPAPEAHIAALPLVLRSRAELFRTAVHAVAAARSGHHDAAAKDLEALPTLALADDSADRQDTLAWVRGEIARSGDASAAEKSFATCSADHALCRLALLEAQSAGHDAVAADATRAALAARFRRDPWTLYAHLRAASAK